MKINGRPVAVAVDDARNRLYVLDSQRHQLLWGTLDGTYQGVIGRRARNRVRSISRLT